MNEVLALAMMAEDDTTEVGLFGVAFDTCGVTSFESKAC